MHYIQANTNGRLHPATEPSIAPLNRGFLYGDAIYEVWRTYHGVLFAWDEHWARLRHSAAALYFALEFEPPQMLQEIRRTVEAYRLQVPGAGDLYIRLQITRGGGPIGLDPALAEGADFLILVQPCPVIHPAVAQFGLHLAVATQLRRNPAQSLNPAWKTGNYLNNLLCLREGKAAGADDVLILNLAGEITEASVSNVAFVRAGQVLTPPLSAGILNGITRSLMLGGVAAAAGLLATEQTVRPEDLATMEECFLLSTTKDVVPVGRVGSFTYKVGADTITARLKRAFGDAVRAYSDQHSDLRV